MGLLKTSTIDYINDYFKVVRPNNVIPPKDPEEFLFNGYTRTRLSAILRGDSNSQQESTLLNISDIETQLKNNTLSLDDLDNINAELKKINPSSNENKFFIEIVRASLMQFIQESSGKVLNEPLRRMARKHKDEAKEVLGSLDLTNKKMNSPRSGSYSVLEEYASDQVVKNNDVVNDFFEIKEVEQEELDSAALDAQVSEFDSGRNQPLSADAINSAKEWCRDIDDYYFDYTQGGQTSNSNGSSNVQQRVNEILDVNARSKLYESVDPVQSKSAREKYLSFLAGIHHNGKIANGINQESISMKELLGEKGLKLYKAAMKEEAKSIAFRNAVFLKSTNNYPGPVWDEKIVQWVGGPSASGKSFGSDAVLKSRINDGSIAVKHDDRGNPIEGDNFIVSVDGGVEREISQIRQMTLSAALHKGYSDINNLHEHSKQSIKGRVKKAAAEQGLSLLIPATFTEKTLGGHMDVGVNSLFESFKKEGYSQSLSIITSDDMERFRETTKKSGENRAKLTGDRRPPEIGMRNLNLPCESKEYQAKHFDAGVRASEIAEKIALDLGIPVVHIKSDLVYQKEEGVDVALAARDLAIVEAAMDGNDVKQVISAERPELNSRQVADLAKLAEKNKNSIKSYAKAIRSENLSASPVLETVTPKLASTKGAIMRSASIKQVDPPKNRPSSPSLRTPSKGRESVTSFITLDTKEEVRPSSAESKRRSITGRQ